MKPFTPAKAVIRRLADLLPVMGLREVPRLPRKAATTSLMLISKRSTTTRSRLNLKSTGARKSLSRTSTSRGGALGPRISDSVRWLCTGTLIALSGSELPEGVFATQGELVVEDEPHWSGPLCQ
ncbi:protein of unknown function [Candidatus Filomicrobium marinum]|nr:protein of unknown function [Candidatus Filomicrobium marinum]